MEVPDGVAGAGVVDPRGKNKFRAGGESRGVVLLSKIPIGVCVGEGVEGKVVLYVNEKSMTCELLIDTNILLNSGIQILSKIF